MTQIPSLVNLCHFFDFFHPKNPYEKYTPPYGTARGDPILMEGTVYDFWILKMQRKTTYVPMWSTGATPGSTCVNGRCNSCCRQIELLSNNSHSFLTCALGVVFVTLLLSHTEIYSFCEIGHINSRGMHQGRSQRIAPLPAWCNENKWVDRPSL
jgi:hypothetical protein